MLCLSHLALLIKLLFGSPSVLSFVSCFIFKLTSFHFRSFTSCPHVFSACVITCPALMCCTYVSPPCRVFSLFVFSPLSQFVLFPCDSGPAFLVFSLESLVLLTIFLTLPFCLSSLYLCLCCLITCVPTLAWLNGLFLWGRVCFWVPALVNHHSVCSIWWSGPY